MLARALGAERLIVVINKMDLVDWSKERYDEIKTNVEPFLIKKCGYKKDFIQWVCISGLVGTNIKDKVDQKLAPWYSGPTLFKAFDLIPSVKREEVKVLRIPILDKFEDQGVQYVYGKIECGFIKANMECVVMPYQKDMRITGVFDVEDN